MNSAELNRFNALVLSILNQPSSAHKWVQGALRSKIMPQQNHVDYFAAVRRLDEAFKSAQHPSTSADARDAHLTEGEVEKILANLAKSLEHDQANAVVRDIIITALGPSRLSRPTKASASRDLTR